MARCTVRHVLVRGTWERVPLLVQLWDSRTLALSYLPGERRAMNEGNMAKFKLDKKNPK